MADKNSSALAVAQVTGITKGAQHETAISSAAAQAQALVQSRYIMAYQRPRDIDEARIKLIKACQRPRFAETAIYSKPMGMKKNEQTGKWEQQYIEGPSIRFAEEAARAMGNLDIQQSVIFDDFEKRIIGVFVADLECNTVYSAEVVVQKTVERKKLKEGQQSRGSRLNSYGDTVYLVEATDDDLLNKQNALVSKAIRTAILRVVPSDIREEAIEMARDTMDKRDAVDPDAARKAMASAFSSIGVSPVDLKKFLGHELGACSPAQLTDLRKVYASIKEGESTWAEHLKAKAAAEAAEAPDAEPEVKTRSQAAKDAVKAKSKAAAPAAPQPPAQTYDEHGEYHDEGDPEPGAGDTP